jgi:putative ABC transport system substrate-binding protein
MQRRQFIAGLGGVVAWPLAAPAQQPPALPVVGYLSPSSPNLPVYAVSAFRQSLGATGYVEGRNVQIEYRWAEDQNDRLPALADDLVRSRVSAIFAVGSLAARAAKAATETIPIVFTAGSDPVELRLVASLDRPGGNLTGVSNSNAELGPKRLELLHELAPTATDFALLVNPTGPAAGDTILRDLQVAARVLSVRLHILHASSERDFDSVFASSVQRAGGLVIGTDALFNSRSEQLATLALRYAVPTISQDREFVAAGGLMSYGASFMEAFREAGSYIGRILKGEKPSDLPVKTTRVELIINLKTAKTLNLTFPPTLLNRADAVL